MYEADRWPDQFIPLGVALGFKIVRNRSMTTSCRLLVLSQGEEDVADVKEIDPVQPFLGMFL